MRPRSEDSVLGALSAAPEPPGVAEERVARELGLDRDSVHALLSRLFVTGRIRYVRSQGVMCYERVSAVPV